MRLCNDTDLCFFGGAPTLGQINAAYGRNTATAWLMIQLQNLSEYSGCRDKLEAKPKAPTDIDWITSPLEMCAYVIATEFYYLSVTELMLFFHRFKSGRYGHFYGAVDPMVITTSLRKFSDERAALYERHKQELQEKKFEESKKNAISWEEYCKKTGQVGKKSPLDRLYTKFLGK